MEKVYELIDYLQELKNSNASLTTLLYYTQLLHAEITRLKTIEVTGTTQINVSVILPAGALQQTTPAVRVDIPRAEESFSQPEPVLLKEEKKSVPPLQPVIKPAATLFEIPAEIPKEKVKDIKPATAKEINETIAVEQTSMNERLRESKTELAEKLGNNPVHDLKIAIGINEKFRFITELFMDDVNMYERSVKTINSFSNLREAENWMERELKVKLGWVEKNETVQLFYAIVRKRFS